MRFRSPFFVASFFFFQLSVLSTGTHALASSSSPTATAIKVLYAGPTSKQEEYNKYLTEALEEAKLNAIVLTLTDDPDDATENNENVDYIVYSPKGPLKNLEESFQHQHVKAVFNLRAGIEGTEHIPSNIPVTRMVDPGLRQGMVEYVVGHVLRYHLGMDQLWKQKQAGKWTPHMPPLARQSTVGILGLGELGRSCADALIHLNFQVCGWSRTPKKLSSTTTGEVEGNTIQCYHGSSGLEQVLRKSDILVLLLPNTPATQNVINHNSLAKCKRRVCIINAGRGSTIHEDDLVQALQEGQVGGATLDVFQTEPLPTTHPFWNQPNVLITPHIAAKTRPETACRVIVENIRRAEAGEPLLYLIDRDAGY